VLADSIIIALIMEAASTSGKAVNFYQTTWRNNLGDSQLLDDIGQRRFKGGEEEKRLPYKPLRNVRMKHEVTSDWGDGQDGDAWSDIIVR
jgi:hypothetical protein